MTPFETTAQAISNAQWTSEDHLPDPNPLPFIPGWKLLVRPIPVTVKTKGGIIVPESVRDDMRYLNTCGRVLAVGDRAYSHPDHGGKPWCKVGDFIVYDKFVGKRITYKGVKLLILKDEHVELVVPSADSIL